ncbi:MAG: hypothetical protein IJV35_10330 [Neisseriaceae bacterium]|nr:hypothetical protein [Neisseriaceae bacterium]
MKKQRHTKKFTVIASIALRQCVRNLFAMENGNAKRFSGSLTPYHKTPTPQGVFFCPPVFAYRVLYKGVLA